MTSRKHSEITSSRVRLVFKLCGIKLLGEVQLEAVQNGLRELKQSQNLSPSTYNHYQQALQAFGKWCVATKRLAVNPLQGLERLNAEVDIRRKRRALLPDELARMLEAARISDVKVEGYTGAERIRIYVLAYMTGLRRNELASLTPRNFQLSADQPTLTVEAAFSKHRRRDVLPLHPELIAFLKPCLDTLSPDERLFPDLARRKTAKMVKHDLEQAGIEYKTRDGVADFHAAGRHTYITELLRNGTSLPEAKALARHADISITMRYTHIGLADQAQAIAKLPAPKFKTSAAQIENPNSPEMNPIGPAESPALPHRCNPSVAPRPATSRRVSKADTIPRNNAQPDKTFGTTCRNLSPHGKMESVGAMPTAWGGHAKLLPRNKIRMLTQSREHGTRRFGPLVRLPMLSTPPRGDAVSFGYRIKL